MLAFVLRRLVLALLVALTVSGISFSLLFLSGDPAVAIAGEQASASDIEAVRELYGFDRPVAVQYADWLGHAIEGDFGESYYFKLPVAKLIADRLQITMTLGVCGILFALLTAVPLGVAAAIRPNSWIDRAALFLSVAGQAMPSFWFGLILIVVFSIRLGLPACLGLGHAGPFRAADDRARLLRDAGDHAADPRRACSRCSSSDYIRTARAKGLRPSCGSCSSTRCATRSSRSSRSPRCSSGSCSAARSSSSRSSRCTASGFLAWESIAAQRPADGAGADPAFSVLLHRAHVPLGPAERLARPADEDGMTLAEAADADDALIEGLRGPSARASSLRRRAASATGA